MQEELRRSLKHRGQGRRTAIITQRTEYAHGETNHHGVQQRSGMHATLAKIRGDLTWGDLIQIAVSVIALLAQLAVIIT